MAPFTDLDLLQEKTNFSVTPTNCHKLTTIQLAIAALRADLDGLTRQRCYAIYLMRQLYFTEEGFERRVLEPLFEIDHFAPLPLHDISSLTPSQLLIAQFGSEVSDSHVQQCGEHFLLRATTAQHSKRQGRTMPLAQFVVKSMKLEKAGGSSVETTALALMLGDGALVVLQDGEDEIWACAATSISEVKYLAGDRMEQDGIAKQYCSLQISVKSYHRLDKEVLSPSKVTLALGPLATRASSFVTLRTTIKRWSSANNFSVTAIEEIDGRPRIRSRPSSRQSHESLIITPTPAAFFSRKRERSPSKLVSENPRNQEPRRDESSDHRGRGGSDGLRAIDRLSAKPSWLQYISDIRASPDQTPAFFTRQAALVRAIDSKAEEWLSPMLPIFDHWEIVFLNFVADGGRLPKLPRSQEDTFRCVVFERLALETIYNNAAGSAYYVDVDSCRWLLSGESRDNPVGFEDSLLAYVSAVTKVITCREKFKQIWGLLLRDLERAVKGAPRDDRVHNTIELVRKLHASEGFRARFFTDQGQVIHSVNGVGPEDLGQGVYNRYVKLFEECAEYERTLRGHLLLLEGRV